MELLCAVECTLNNFGRTISAFCLEPNVSIIVQLLVLESPTPKGKVINLLVRLA